MQNALFQFGRKQTIRLQDKGGMELTCYDSKDILRLAQNMQFHEVHFHTKRQKILLSTCNDIQAFSIAVLLPSVYITNYLINISNKSKHLINKELHNRTIKHIPHQNHTNLTDLSRISSNTDSLSRSWSDPKICRYFLILTAVCPLRRRLELIASWAMKQMRPTLKT